MTTGSIELARSQCNRIAGELEDGEVYGSVDVAVILSGEIEQLESEALAATIRMDNDKAEINSLTQQLRKEQLEVQELAANAARYQFMKNLSRAYSLNISGNHAWMCQITRDNIKGATLDEAIDNAMKETK